MAAITGTPVSRAIPIVAPPPASPGPDRNRSNTLTKKEASTPQRQCRNILIFGSCKNEGKTCTYYHPPRQEVPAPPVTPPPLPSPPTTSVGASPSVNVNAAVFVPRGVLAAPFTPKQSQVPPADDTFRPSTPPPDHEVIEANAQSTFGSPGFHYQYQQDEQQPIWDPTATAQYSMQQLILADEQNAAGDLTMTSNGGGYDPGLLLDHGMYADSMMMMGHNPFAYPTQSNFIRQPLNYHLYAPTLPYVTNIPTSQRHFISDTVREDLQKRSEAIYSTVPLPGAGFPEEIHSYHSLVPLEAYPPPPDRRKVFGGYPSSVYKATNKENGSSYTLRRVEGFRMLHESAFSSVEKWAKLRHPNVVTVIEAFTTRQFNDYSLVFVYDFHPNAQTLYQLHFSSSALSSASAHSPVKSTHSSKNAHGKHHNHAQNSSQGHVPESTIWTYVVQIANAIKAVHDLGLAVRSIDATKILVTGKNRVRLNCCGVFDVVAWNQTAQLSIEALQQEDLVALGKIVIGLCCGNLNGLNNLPKSLDNITRHYSQDLKNVVLFLVCKPSPSKIIDVLLDMFGTRLLTEMNAMQSYSDDLETQLMSELENARLVRLLCKFGFINERPEFNHEPRWSETGDRYIIKLFRDYVFHQVDEVGNPVVNMSHVLTCLNKLDVGTDERIMLVSRDEQSCLVVSYKEVKSCIEQAYGELSRAAR